MIDSKQITNLIIEPTLYKLCISVPGLVRLLEITCKEETNYGCKLLSHNKTKFGIFFMHEDNYNSIWNHFIPKSKSINSLIKKSFDVFETPVIDRMIHDLEFAALMAALQYIKESYYISDTNNDQKIYDCYASIWNAPPNPNIIDFRSYKNIRDKKVWAPPL